MLKNISKIYKRSTFLILAIIISGLLNLCLFTFQARTTQPIEPLKLNFVYNNSGNCFTEPTPEPSQTINYPSAPMPECCLTRTRNFDALVNTTNDKSAPVFASLMILSADNSNQKNNYSYHTARLAYPPPAALALAATVMRE